MPIPIIASWTVALPVFEIFAEECQVVCSCTRMAGITTVDAWWRNLALVCFAEALEPSKSNMGNLSSCSLRTTAAGQEEGSGLSHDKNLIFSPVPGISAGTLPHHNGPTARHR